MLQRTMADLTKEIERLTAELAYERQRADDCKTAMGEALDALKIVRQCATDRLADIRGDTTTYEDAFRKLGITCGALIFIEGHAARSLN